MDNLEKIKNVLIATFESVYCNSCSSQKSEENCDECNRKSMNWEISEGYAERVASLILKEISE